MVTGVVRSGTVVGVAVVGVVVVFGGAVMVMVAAATAAYTPYVGIKTQAFKSYVVDGNSNLLAFCVNFK